MAFDWPNLLLGTALGFVAAAAYYYPGKRDSDSKHGELLTKHQELIAIYSKLSASVERLEQAGQLKAERDDRGRVVVVEPLYVEPAALTIRGQQPTLIGPDGTKR